MAVTNLACAAVDVSASVCSYDICPLHEVSSAHIACLPLQNIDGVFSRAYVTIACFMHWAPEGCIVRD